MTSPLVDPAVDITDFPFMPIMIAQLQRSKAWLICKKKPQLAFYMLNLWMAAWHGRPAASVENDDMVLADVAGCDDKTWAKVRTEVLRGWIACDDGRLYHPVVAERAREAWARKIARRNQTEAARLAREAERLRKHEAHRAEVARLSGETGKPSTTRSVTNDVTDSVAGIVSRSKGEGEGQGQGEGQGEGKESTSLRSGEGAGGSFVERFFMAYPIHASEDGVRRELARIVADGIDLEQVLAGAKRYAQSVAGKSLDKIANPVGWLRDGRWKDGTMKTPATVVDTHTSVRRTDPRWSRLSQRWKNERGKVPPDTNSGSWAFPNQWIQDLEADNRVSA